MHLPILTVSTAGGSYGIVVGAGVLQTLPAQLRTLGLNGTLWLISDSEVYPRYGAAVEGTLRAAGHTVHSFPVPSGEASKDLAVVSQLYDWMIGDGVERNDVVLALGGGVVGDLAGFVAASVLRGIALIQIPTTLLAMIDSAIGGKTGVNHRLGKNLIGAFHQPRLVLSDIETLATLPLRELRAGWAEVIKHGVIRDAGLFQILEQRADEFATTRFLDPNSQTRHMVGEIIRRAAAVKVMIVSADERESGERMLLNYGHTLGQALEAATGYRALLHGEAIAIGMHLAIQIAQRLGMCSAELVERQKKLLHAYGLPTKIPAGTSADQLLALTLHDKKVHNKRVRWVLPTALGAITVRDDVPEPLIRHVVEATTAKA